MGTAASKCPFYEWKNEKFSNKIQDIRIPSSYGCNTFTVDSITYIGCGIKWRFTADVVRILKWSGKQFEPFQDLLTSSLYMWGRPLIIKANGTVYLAIANFQGINFDIDSFIYRWNGVKFVLHQSIQTHGVKGWDFFSTARGEVFLVVANSYTQGGAGTR